MKKLRKIFLVVFTALISIALILIIYLSIEYSPGYLYRYIVWTPPGNSDLYKFPSRLIEACPETNRISFNVDLKEDYVESLFNDRIHQLGLNSFDEYIKLTGTTALIFIKADTIIYEKYFNGFKRNSFSMAMSMTKSFVNSLLGIAIDEGYVKNINEPIVNYIPELLNHDKRFENIKIKNLLMMNSGLEQRKALFHGVPLPWDGDPVSYYYPNLRDYIINNLNIIDNPGKRFYYNDFNAELLGLILERSLPETPSEYLQEKIWKPCGMEYPAKWTMDSEESKFEKKSSGLFARPIDYARYGYLYLNKGRWQGKQIIPENWITESMQEDSLINNKDYWPNEWISNTDFKTYYKYHWKAHVNRDSTINYSIGGVYGQNIYLAPHKDLIIVHCGTSQEYYGVEDLWYVERIFNNPFFKILNEKGIPEAIEYFRQIKKADPDRCVFPETHLNRIGYNYLNRGEIKKAISIFELNVSAYPKSSNTYDSLGEAYMKAGNKGLAIKNYKKSLELNPNNKNAEEILKRLRNNK